MTEDNNNQNLDLSPEELRNIKSQYNKAKDILEKISALQTKFESAQASLVVSQTEIEKISNNARERFGTIENAKNDSATFIAEIKSNLEKTQTSITQIDEGLRKFENIKGKIEGRDGEIDVLVSTANGLKTDIESAKTTAQQRLADIDGLLTQVQDKVSQMQKAYESFVAVQGKITDKTTGLEAILAQSKDLQKKSTEVFTEIKSFRDESKKYLDEIQGNKETSTKVREEIEQNLKIAEDKRSEVEKVADLITDTGFANSFQKREKILRINAYVWLGIFFVSIIALAVLLYKFFGNLQTVPELEILLYRLTLTSPLLFLIGFVIRQHGNERTLEERYAFKATIAVVMRNHADFLIEKAKNTDPDTSIFIRRTIGNLYSEPYEKGVDWKKIKKELQTSGEKDDSKKTRIADLLEKAKELKTLIPDEALLKSLIDLLLKFK